MKLSDLKPETLARMNLPTENRTNKYHVSRKDERTRDGITFASKLEMHHYDHLNLMKRNGLVKYFLRQTAIHLPGNVRYLVDFLVFYTDGRIEYQDCKGMKTQTYILKRKQVEDLYPIKIVEVKRESR